MNHVGEFPSKIHHSERGWENVEQDVADLPHPHEVKLQATYNTDESTKSEHDVVHHEHAEP